MTVHLIKLCVGVDHIDDLTAWGREARGLGRTPVITTRHRPKRVDEILAGGSLYWVIKGVIACRQNILAFTEAEGKCCIHLAAEVVPTVGAPRRPFQGWRYLSAADAPADWAPDDAAELPSDLAAQLKALGAW